MLTQKIAPLIALLSLGSFSGCYESGFEDESETIVGSGRIVTDEQTVEPCKGIVIRGAGDLFLSQNDDPEILIEADDNIIDRVVTYEENDLLIVGLETGSYTRITLRIYVSLPTIEWLGIEGAGNIYSETPIECDELYCSITGAGNIFLNGSGNYLECLINGAGNIDAKEFVTESCKAVLVGAGNCTVYVTEELEALITGVGTIRYYGRPTTVTTTVTGTGTIVRK